MQLMETKTGVTETAICYVAEPWIQLNGLIRVFQNGRVLPCLYQISSINRKSWQLWKRSWYKKPVEIIKRLKLPIATTESDFQTYSFEDIPLNRESYLADEICIGKYKSSRINESTDDPVAAAGYISHVKVLKINETSLDLSWYPNIFTRFHEIKTSLPKEAFVSCMRYLPHDEPPHMFVKTTWLKQLHLKNYSVFCLVDAIGVKNALKTGSLSREKLIALRTAIDALGAHYPGVSFISFADSLLLKSNWMVGHAQSEVTYTYEPEVFFTIIKNIQMIYKTNLDLDVYAVLTQGCNEYYEDALLHISRSKNHICLNSLGVPFAQLLSIDDAVRSAIKNETHAPSELYMDAQFYNSLRFGRKKRSRNKYEYRTKIISGTGNYYCGQCQEMLDDLKLPQNLNIKTDENMSEDNYTNALVFWTIALQYLSMVENVSKEIVKQGNNWVLIEDHPMSNEEYFLERANWSDHNLIIPLLFNLYHGLELLLKGLLLSKANGTVKPHHVIQDLSRQFADSFPNEAELNRCFSKYTEEEHLPPLILNFLRDNELSFNALYQALRYPADAMFGNIKKYFTLKYQGKEGLTFFNELIADLVVIRESTCRLVK